MYSEFAYSRVMQLILAVITFASSFIFVYLTAGLILLAYGENASRKQKSIFALLVGNVLHNVWVYGVYLIGGLVSFSKPVYYIIVTPNPFFALLFYLIGIKVLKLSPIRSIRLMRYVFTYYITVHCFQRVINAIFFVQQPGPYNYMLDAVSGIVKTIVVVIISFVVSSILKRTKFYIKISENVFINPKKELFFLFINASMIYGLNVIFPIVISEQFAASLFLFVIMALIFALNIMLDINNSVRMDVNNRDVYINALSKGIDEFSAIKHDFYNILQTYGGYIEVGNLEALKKHHASLLNLTTHAGSAIDLSKRMNENPGLISLLISKHDYAEKLNVKMRVELLTIVENLYINTVEICRVIACLLDNAIEAAADSEQKKVSFTISSKNNGSKLIVITNSTAEPIDTYTIISRGITSKHGHDGIGLSTVRNTISKNGNCTFKLTYYNYELSAYIEIGQTF